MNIIFLKYELFSNLEVMENCMFCLSLEYVLVVVCSDIQLVILFYLQVLVVFIIV